VQIVGVNVDPHVQLKLRFIPVQVELHPPKPPSSHVSDPSNFPSPQANTHKRIF